MDGRLHGIIGVLAFFNRVLNRVPQSRFRSFDEVTNCANSSAHFR